jgi:hypothetical protein
LDEFDRRLGDLPKPVKKGDPSVPVGLSPEFDRALLPPWLRFDPDVLSFSLPVE